MDYYVKIKAALKAGYFVVPNFPVDVFAIRTVKKTPRAVTDARRYNPRLPDQSSEAPPKGQGEWVDPSPLVESDQWEEPDGKDGNGKELTKTMHSVTACEWDDPDFPIAKAKPMVMGDTLSAAALKIFDELGVAPSRTGRDDPIIIGRIIHRAGGQERVMSFMVAWWMNISDM